jgi:hypothetical protein
MKKPCYLLALALVLASCTSPKTEEQKETLAAQESTVAQEAPGIAPISLDEAATYISNFLNHPAYGNMGRKVAVGGAFTKAAFEVPAGQGGVLFWYCQNKNDAAYPEFFLALDHIPGYDSAAVPAAPAGDVMSPDYTFTYTEAKNDVDAVKHFLETLSIENKIQNKTLPKAKAEAMIAEFRTLIGHIGNCETDNCKYPLGYFDGQQGNYMNAFLSKNPTMVRYFYGYDKSYGGNSIRIILIGTNNQGSNILSLTASDGAILQKSVPPPPIY